MGLDLRLPMGALFAIFGVLLTGYGLLSDPAMYEQSLGYNLNLWWGLVLLIFGGMLIYYGRRGTSAMQPAETTPEGRAMEEREHRTGKEDSRPVQEDAEP